MIDLAPRHLQAVLALLQQYVPGVEVWAFGSRVTGNAKPFSDLDLVLKGSGPLPQSGYFRLLDAFEESDLPFKVDVLDWHRISDEFRANIVRHYQVLIPG